jgi:hypothetical protein
VHIADVQLDHLSELGLPNSDSTSQLAISDIEQLLESLKRIFTSDKRMRLYSQTFSVTEDHVPRWLNGGGIDVPVMAEDGSIAVVERYDGDIIIAEPHELANGNVLLSFDLTSQNLDYGNPTKVGDINVYSQFTRQLKSQVEIPKGTFIAVPAGKRNDRDGVERELVFILTAERTRPAK